MSMLTIEELKKRIERDQELFEQITAERETVRIRLYRYRKAVIALNDAHKELDFDPSD